MLGTIDYSVIVPAYKEASNLRPLVTRIFESLNRIDSPVPAGQVEIIVVDDNSRDGSVEVVQALQQEGYNVRIIVRTAERGLSSAVVRGFQEAQGDNMLCMDADLQVSPVHHDSVQDDTDLQVASTRIRTSDARSHVTVETLRARDAVRWQCWSHRRRLASLPPNHLKRCAPSRASFDFRERPHVRVLRYPERSCAYSAASFWCLLTSCLTVPEGAEPEHKRVQDRARAAREGADPLKCDR